MSQLKQLWSATRFHRPEIAEYAEAMMIRSTRHGIVTLSLCSLLLQLAAIALYWLLDFDERYFYTYGLLTGLSLHILISSFFVRDIRVLNLLGMVLLVVTATAFMLLTHNTGQLTPGMMASMVLLFMAMPLVPWGLREASWIVGTIYLVFTVSAFSVSGRFEFHTLLTLQFFVVSAASIAILLVARNVYVRKDDIRARYDLENAHRKMELLSFKDPLTGAWNRRFLDNNFAALANDLASRNRSLAVVLLDVDDFKTLNDTHGHDAGDLCLKWLVAVFAEHLDPEAFIVRLGGDEFVLVGAEDGIESQVRSAIALLENEVERGRIGPVTQLSVTFGIANTEPGQTAVLSELYKWADVRLYEAKRRRKVGRDRQAAPAEDPVAGEVS